MTLELLEKTEIEELTIQEMPLVVEPSVPAQAEPGSDGAAPPDSAKSYWIYQVPFPGVRYYMYEGPK